MHTVKIKDSEYLISPHPFDEGLQVMDLLLTLGLGTLISTILDSAKIREDDSPEEMQAAMLRAMDASVISDTLITGLQRSGGLTKIIPLLLRYTRRNGTLLNNEAARNEAFTGNYGEVVKVVREVIDVNGFFDALSTMVA